MSGAREAPREAGVGPAERTYYCSYCLHFLDVVDDFCPHPPCGRTRPAAGWAYFFESGEAIDGRYSIRERLGAGGAGVTYRAIDLTADDPDLRDVAIKVLHRDRGQGILRDRLRLEGEVLRRLEHPHVVPFRALKVDGNEPYYLATGYVPGGSLDDLLRSQQRLAARTVLVVGAQIARALGAAHAIGVTHRDLKPANILVRDLDEYPLYVRVADWGIARAVPEFVPRRHVTIQGGFVGTPEFASPEQIRGDPSVGPPTDVFGLGILMHILAGGQPVRDLIARGKVDFDALRAGASRYERVPLFSGGNPDDLHLPLLDELVDQLITRAPDARPDADTVAAYCEELIEAGDTAPRNGRAMAPLPALAPAAAFEPARSELFLPPDGGRARPLDLTGEAGRTGGVPPTLESEDPPEQVSEMPPESPWEGSGATPTAVPEQMASAPALEVLHGDAGAGAIAHPPVANASAAEAPGGPPASLSPTRFHGEPRPSPDRLPAGPAPINERDDEPFRRRRGLGSWVLAVVVAAGIVVALGLAAPELRASVGEALAPWFGVRDWTPGDGAASTAGTGDDGSAELGAAGEEGPRAAFGRRVGYPTAPVKVQSVGDLFYEPSLDGEGAAAGADDPGARAGGGAAAGVPATGGGVARPSAGSPEDGGAASPSGGVDAGSGTDPGSAAGAAGAGGEAGDGASVEGLPETLAEADPDDPPPSEGVVVDHGTEESGGRVRSGLGRGRSGRSSWAARPGAQMPWGSGYRAERGGGDSRPAEGTAGGGREGSRWYDPDDSRRPSEVLEERRAGGGESAGGAAGDEGAVPAAGEPPADETAGADGPVERPSATLNRGGGKFERAGGEGADAGSSDAGSPDAGAPDAGPPAEEAAGGEVGGPAATGDEGTDHPPTSTETGASDSPGKLL